VQDFPKTARLPDRAVFERVLRHGKRYRTQGLTVSYLPGNQPRARLGLVVPKRQVRHATMRNRIKRVVRESFRMHGSSLCPGDVVVLVYREAAELPAAALRQAIDGLLARCPQHLQQDSMNERVLCAIS
jgi:ribonuclease P protein component